MEATQKTIEERVIQCIAEELGLTTSEVEVTYRIVDDLGADSLDIVELIMRFEEEFNIEIQDEDAEKIVTVQNAVDYVQRRTGA